MTKWTGARRHRPHHRGQRHRRHPSRHHHPRHPADTIHVIPADAVSPLGSPFWNAGIQVDQHPGVRQQQRGRGIDGTGRSCRGAPAARPRPRTAARGTCRGASVRRTSVRPARPANPSGPSACRRTGRECSTVTATIRRPVITPARPARTVSTSGSSGTPRFCQPQWPAAGADQPRRAVSSAGLTRSADQVPQRVVDVPDADVHGTGLVRPSSPSQ